MRKGDYPDTEGGPASVVYVYACRKAQGHGPREPIAQLSG